MDEIAPTKELTRSQKYYYANRERLLAANRAWCIANRERRNAYQSLRLKTSAKAQATKVACYKRWISKNKQRVSEWTKQYTQKNLERIRERRRLYHQKTYPLRRESIIEATKQYAKSHPEVRKKYYKNYVKTHPEITRARNKAKNARRKAAIRGAATCKKTDAMIRSWKVARFFLCHYCGRCFSTKHLQIDHFIPIIKGGGHTVDNIRPSCGPCNSRKRDKFVSPFCWITTELANSPPK